MVWKFQHTGRVPSNHSQPLSHPIHEFWSPKNLCSLLPLLFLYFTSHFLHLFLYFDLILALVKVDDFLPGKTFSLVVLKGMIFCEILSTFRVSSFKEDCKTPLLECYKSWRWSFLVPFVVDWVTASLLVILKKRWSVLVIFLFCIIIMTSAPNFIVILWPMNEILIFQVALFIFLYLSGLLILITNKFIFVQCYTSTIFGNIRKPGVFCVHDVIEV